MSDPAITIAGRRWPVPLLAPRQNRIVLPALLKAGSPPDYARLADCVFAALTRAHPEIVRADFEDWPAGADEFIAALPVIAKQTGFLGPRGSGPQAAGTAAVPELPDWDAIIAEFVNFLPGTTPDYWEDALTAPRLAALREEWRRHPPLVLLAAAFLGYRPKPANDDALAELLRLFPDGKLRGAAVG